MKNEKLVLVLDLDNTLMHSREYMMKPEMARHHTYRKSCGSKLIDEDRSIYHIWAPRTFSFYVKLRPFCAEFLIEAMVRVITRKAASCIELRRRPRKIAARRILII